MTQEMLKKVLHYDPETGIFTWVALGTGKCHPRAGSVRVDGYLAIGINRKVYAAHRLAWLYVYGHFPEADLDHINGDKWDNRMANLREASESENCCNSKIPKHNSSGHKGVSWVKRDNLWKAQIRLGRKVVFQKLFKSKEDAITAVKKARAKLHGEFARDI